jgi:hypothetical protein
MFKTKIQNNSVKTFLVVLVFIITLVLFNSIEGTFRDLFQTTLRTVKNLNQFNQNLDTPQAGEDILPLSVQEMLTLLRTHDLNSYQLSSGIAADVWAYMQIIATAWPRKFESSAKDRFFLISEPIPSNCTLKAKKKEVSLVHCR